METFHPKFVRRPNAVRAIANHPNDDHALPVDTRVSDERARESRSTVQSWKEIACELDRAVRTVQRWERTLGLPVRRVGKGRRSPVFAFKDELQDWMRNQGDASLSKGPTVNSRIALKGRTMTDPELLQSISKLLASLASIETQKNCCTCCAPMQRLEGQFWIYGTDCKVQIPLALCPVCDVAILGRFQKSLSIQ